MRTPSSNTIQLIETLKKGQAWADETGRVYHVFGVVGDGRSVSDKPEIAAGQREGPVMALLVREDMAPHIFDWIGEGSLRRSYRRVPSHDDLPLR
jgi:hypothetical protein